MGRKTKQHSQDQFQALTVQEVADLLQVSPSYVYKLCSGKVLPVLNIPGVVRIDRIKFFRMAGITDPVKQKDLAADK